MTSTPCDPGAQECGNARTEFWNNWHGLAHSIKHVTPMFNGALDIFDLYESVISSLEFRLSEALSKAAKLDAPNIHDFAQAIVSEAAHQRERWGTKDDAGKSPEDWLWLIAFLATKATQAMRYGDYEKYLHHIITCAAACCNWHANATGKNIEMKAGASGPVDSIPKS